MQIKAAIESDKRELFISSLPSQSSEIFFRRLFCVVLQDKSGEKIHTVDS